MLHLHVSRDEMLELVKVNFWRISLVSNDFNDFNILTFGISCNKISESILFSNACISDRDQRLYTMLFDSAL